MNNTKKTLYFVFICKIKHQFNVRIFFDTMVTLKKKIKINYQIQFSINAMCKDKKNLKKSLTIKEKDWCTKQKRKNTLETHIVSVMWGS